MVLLVWKPNCLAMESVNIQKISPAEISKIGGLFGPDQITICHKATIYKIY